MKIRKCLTTATEKELFAAIRLIKAYCEHKYFCPDCPLCGWCVYLFDAGSKKQPCYWPDAEEVGGKLYELAKKELENYSEVDDCYQK